MVWCGVPCVAKVAALLVVTRLILLVPRLPCLATTAYGLVSRDHAYPLASMSATLSGTLILRDTFVTVRRSEAFATRGTRHAARELHDAKISAVARSVMCDCNGASVDCEGNFNGRQVIFCNPVVGNGSVASLIQRTTRVAARDRGTAVSALRNHERQRSAATPCKLGALRYHCSCTIRKSIHNPILSTPLQ